MRPFVTLILLVACPVVVAAQTLPKGTTPLSASEITEIFAGKTYAFQEKGHEGEKQPISWYLGADGKMLGYTGNGPSYAEGTWSASDGKLCVSDAWTGAWGSNHSTDCQAWAKDAAKPKVLYRAETSKGGKWTKFSPKLADGDTISAKIEVLKAKLKK